ncbi:Aspartyl-phosphate phosphatase Spo0E-like [Acididesulfobacillus acetoxydans]|uniref:Aspartyl-phosphate phosphatase Spo0E-like n=1 Tax=Acididesulfobacillus acetoxydans TaxID=1561005 RepID=A0A8S0VXW5_9FIRM|nr:aspartyl-phosphate phosphatase Spo0E family protein [Acididesulfobacillus acetoxydans]CAA7602373.1 Aspartyl-phosphate phosphatase Spo0E-like [Acididesulfobacillus acetoxydans]CEJ08392.1 Spo0E like sporulation regulatory protein [Acididesulfobacillus acetoxydans]
MESILQRRIERLRRKLNKSGGERGFKDPKVIRMSQELDQLLNQYYEANRYQQLSFW